MNTRTLRSHELFTTITTEGALLPPDILSRLSDRDDLPGIAPGDYHLAGERINEAISRSWNRLTGVWTAFEDAREKLSEKDLGTTATRERWMLPLFQELGYGRLNTTRADEREIEDKTYPISHMWRQTAIHVVGCRLELDTRTPGAAGAARMSPHGMMQEFLNRSDDHLWAFVSNGLRLRLLRDNVSLTRQAYVEFDLEAMMRGEVYSDFVVLWMVCHQSRVEAERPEECWLEKWFHEAARRGTRALDSLRTGVEKAIQRLGRGFLEYPGNQPLRDTLYKGELDPQDYYRTLLRLVYRLIFLFVAEDRGLLFTPESDIPARERYSRYYSTGRLRRLAQQSRGGRHPDLYRSLRIVMEKLGSDDGCPELGLPALGSFLWSGEAIAQLGASDIANTDFLSAIRELAYTEQDRVLRAVDYRNLGAEELGSVYESLLELRPQLNIDAATFELETAAGHERKTTGSYYTPSSLIQCLLDTALDPVLDEACKKDDPEQAILDLKVCDPATGSGHFLIAAAHRMAKRLAAIRSGDDEPSPDATRSALRQIISHCIYGVDINPMAVELCKVSLWMEAMEPGKPLSFLDHRILCGNSLLGATPALIAQGIPDDAFKPLEGDDKKVCSALKKQNKKEREGKQRSFLGDLAREPEEVYSSLHDQAESLEATKDESIQDIKAKEKKYRSLLKSDAFQKAKTTADAWCAVFAWKKTESTPPFTHETLLRLQSNTASVESRILHEIDRLTEQYQYFHWHLSFPDVFPLAGDTAEVAEPNPSVGFDVVLGNPPWEMLEQDPSRASKILAVTQHFIKNSGGYPFTSGARKNLYGLFVELSLKLCSTDGCIGVIVPTGVIQDKPMEKLAERLFRTSRVYSVLDFENGKRLEGGATRHKWFRDVHPQYRFCLMTIRSGVECTSFVFDAQSVSETRQPDRLYEQSYDNIKMLCTGAFKVPMFRSKTDFILTSKAHRSGEPIGVLISDAGLRAGLMFNFGEAEKAAKLPFEERRVATGDTYRVFEGEYIHQYDHRYATWDANEVRKLGDDEHTAELRTATATTLPADFVHKRALTVFGDTPGYFAVVRRQARRSDQHIAIAAVLPFAAVEGSLTVIHYIKNDARRLLLLCANVNSYLFNYLLRIRQAGPNVNKATLSQIPLLWGALERGVICPWEPGVTLQDWFVYRAVEMVYSSWELKDFAADCGVSGPPFRWDPGRRYMLRCELEAAHFVLYGYSATDAAYVLDNRPLVRSRAPDYERDRRHIMAIFDSLMDSANGGRSYATRLKPIPGVRDD